MDEKLWKSLVFDFEKGEENREKIVQLSRKIIQLSKRAIYAAHRHELNGSLKIINEMKPEIAQLQKLQKQASMDAINSVKVAEQEYVEAVGLYHVIKGDSIPSHISLKISAESYLLGLCDLVGEIGRLGVHKIIGNDYESAVILQKFVHDLYGKFMHLNLRNSELRKKVDGVKWELKKMEDVILQLKIAGRIK